MGKIVVKAQQQNVFNLNGNGTTMPAYRPVRYTTMNDDDIVNYCAANSIIPKAYLSASMIAIAQCIENFLLNGHAIAIPNLGTFFLTSSGISEADINKVGMEQFIKLNVRFLPCTKLKAEVEAVTLEFDGVYDIAGEEIVGNRTDGSTKSYKYYKKVRRGQAGGLDTSALRQAQGPQDTSTTAPGLVETQTEDEE